VTVSIMEWDRLIQELFRLAEPYLRVRAGVIHTRVAKDYASVLVEKEDGDKKIVEPAVILHDVGWSALKPDEINRAYGIRATGKKAAELNRVHELEGARIARGILLKLDYNAAFIDEICRIIERHDSGKQPQSLEEKLVKDADKLWRFSRTGYNYEIKRQQTPHEVRYNFLKKHIADWFFTKTGRELAETELRKRAIELS